MDVKCQVKVSHLTLGNREGYEEVKTYRTGDMLDIPEKLARELGNSVVIIGNVEEEKKKEPEELIKRQRGKNHKTSK